jgi:hypothetical protein
MGPEPVMAEWLRTHDAGGVDAVSNRDVFGDADLVGASAIQSGEIPGKARQILPEG